MCLLTLLCSLLIRHLVLIRISPYVHGTSMVDLKFTSEKFCG